ncbi:hypothetical protein [Kribbella sp.]|uniref:hypothetical protein n=1 Tax=Kribbella sp. TaxID=1871183 RepID=UPI002D2A1733|nr:hypothetical protein [Kribbella sp.]HZX08587.1 hypothetical protein [Kribbella sp.]
MTDELKQRFEQLVAEPPAPSRAPSEAVFARVRKARRRRAVGVAGLASAAVVAAVAIAGNLSGPSTQPPVVGPPSRSASAAPKPATPAALGVQLKLTPHVKGRTLTMTIEASGTILVPFVGGYLPTDQGLAGLGQGSTTSYGYGPKVGALSDMQECAKSTKRYTGKATYPPDTFTYPKAGTYTYTYVGQYCGLKKPVIATARVTIR